jgi:hypothetical protein
VEEFDLDLDVVVVENVEEKWFEVLEYLEVHQRVRFGGSLGECVRDYEEEDEGLKRKNDDQREREIDGLESEMK